MQKHVKKSSPHEEDLNAFAPTNTVSQENTQKGPEKEKAGLPGDQLQGFSVGRLKKEASISCSLSEEESNGEWDFDLL